MKSILTILLLLLSVEVFSQGRNAVWCFGDSAGIDFNDPMNPVPISSSMDSRGSCVSIADSSGSILFYANTRAGLPDNTGLIWNSNHQLMQNGDSIVGRGWYKEMLIIPNPNNQTFYLFSIGSTLYPSPGVLAPYFSDRLVGIV